MVTARPASRVASTRPSAGQRTRVARPVWGRKPCSASSAQTRASMAWPRIAISSWARLSGSPAARRSCSSTRSTPVTASVTPCSTWRRVFISRKWTLVAGGQELDGSQAAVADAGGDRGGRLQGAGAGRRRAGRCGRLLDHLLVAPLHRAVAVPQVQDPTGAVPHHLHLQVPPLGEVALHEEGGVAEGRQRLPPGGRQRRHQVGGSGDQTHPPAAPARDCLDQGGVADLRAHPRGQRTRSPPPRQPAPRGRRPPWPGVALGPCGSSAR